jgi:hypothetical protein
MTERRAIKIGSACLAVHAKYQHYPGRLDELMPDVLPSVPVAKYTLGGNNFFYFSPPEGREPMLYYEAFPPFGRRFYHMETGDWATSTETAAHSASCPVAPSAGAPLLLLPASVSHFHGDLPASICLLLPNRDVFPALDFFRAVCPLGAKFLVPPGVTKIA